jgi:hypothetical protein
MLRSLLLCAAMAAVAPGQTFTTIANFGGSIKYPTQIIAGPDI